MILDPTAADPHWIKILDLPHPPRAYRRAHGGDKWQTRRDWAIDTGVITTREYDDRRKLCLALVSSQVFKNTTCK